MFCAFVKGLPLRALHASFKSGVTCDMRCRMSSAYSGFISIDLPSIIVVAQIPVGWGRDNAMNRFIRQLTQSTQDVIDDDSAGWFHGAATNTFLRQDGHSTTMCVPSRSLSTRTLSFFSNCRTAPQERQVIFFLSHHGDLGSLRIFIKGTHSIRARRVLGRQLSFRP